MHMHTSKSFENSCHQLQMTRHQMIKYCANWHNMGLICIRAAMFRHSYAYVFYNILKSARKRATRRKVCAAWRGVACTHLHLHLSGCAKFTHAYAPFRAKHKALHGLVHTPMALLCSSREKSCRLCIDTARIDPGLDLHCSMHVPSVWRQQHS